MSAVRARTAGRSGAANRNRHVARSRRSSRPKKTVRNRKDCGRPARRHVPSSSDTVGQRISQVSFFESASIQRISRRSAIRSLRTSVRQFETGASSYV